MPSKPALTVVTWLDIKSTAHWQEESPSKAEPAVCVTVGWLVHRDEKKLVLADSQTNDGDWGGLTVIPIGVVRKVNRVSNQTPESFIEKGSKR